MSRNPLKLILNGQLQTVARYFSALGEVSRLRILQILNSDEKSVLEIAKLTKLSHSNASRHLSVLVSAGILGKRKDGITVKYTVIDHSFYEICALVCKRVLNHKNHNGI